MAFNKNKPAKSFAQKIEEKKPSDVNGHKNFKVSFQYLDTTQKYASSFLDWQRIGLLSTAMDVLHGYCCSPLKDRLGSDKFKKYGNFPPIHATLFDPPVNIPEDACWARIHINGPAIIAGHIVDDTFFVVFLDKTHKFFMTKKTREQFLGKTAAKKKL